MSKKNDGIVSLRLAFLEGRRVRVRVWWTKDGADGSPGGDPFEATFDSLVPAGRDYFFIFLIEGRRTLVKTSAVLQIEELP